MPHSKNDDKGEKDKTFPRRTGSKFKPRQSPEERKKRQKIEFLLKYVDKGGRTRGSAKLRSVIESDENGAKLQAAVIAERLRKTPPRKVNGENIYSGKSRSFTAEFTESYWSRQTQNGRVVLCDDCENVIDMDATGGDGRTIDHKTDWAVQKTELETVDVCFNGHHWRVVMAQTMRAEFENENNLVPMHRSCNSSKNGSKSHDSIAPQCICACDDGEHCSLDKATG